MKTEKIIPSALLLTLLSLFSPATAPAATYYVAVWGNDFNRGTADGPFRSTQQAFEKAAESGDTILLYDGTYAGPGNTRSKSITLVSLNGATNCIFEFAEVGDLGTLHLNSLERNPVTTIRGFTFRNATGSCLSVRGGCTVTIENCLFSGNRYAPAVSIVDTTSTNLLIRNCIFNDNSLHDMYDLWVNRFGGGAIRVNGYGKLEVRDCQFFGNTALQSSHHGGAIWSDLNLTVLVNCVFVANRSSQGGAVRAGRLGVYNCTFAGNVSPSTLGNAIWADGDLEIVNSILWDGGTYELWTVNSNVTVRRSNIQGGYPGNVNLDADPKFVRNPGALGPSDPGDLHLQITSPCRNSGVTSVTDRDLEGTPRPMESGYDMGAYEFRDGPVGYWYVDAARGNDADSNSGTPTSPLATVTKAVTQAVDGNRIYVKQGNYGSDRPRITKALQLFNWGDTGLARIGQP